MGKARYNSVRIGYKINLGQEDAVLVAVVGRRRRVQPREEQFDQAGHATAGTPRQRQHPCGQCQHLNGQKKTR